MAKKFLVNIDLGGNQLLSALVHQAPNSTPPTAYGKGQLWFDTTNNQLNVYNGTSFQPLATGGTAVSSLNSFTGGVNIYGTANQITVTNNSGSITLSLPSTISGVSANLSGASVSGSRLTSISDSLGVFAATTSSQLAGVISDETGTGSLVFNNAPTFTGVVNLGTSIATGSVTTATNSSSLAGQPGSYYYPASSITSATVAYATNAGTATSATNATNITSGGTVTTNALSATTGSFTGAVTLAGGGTISSGQTLTNSGTISGGTLSPTTLNIPAGTYSSASVGYATNAGTATNVTAGGTVTTGALNATTGSFSGALTAGTDLNVNGNLFVTGSTTFVSGSTAAIITDPILYIANGNVANLFDIGIVGHFTSGTYQHTGLVRDHNANLWRLFSGVVTEPSSSVNFASATYDALALGGLNVYSSSTTVSASITGAGFLTAPSANFTSALQLNGSAVATQAYVTGLGYPAKYTGTITGNGTSASFTITHNLNTRDAVIQVYQTSATPDTQYAEVEADIVRTSTTTAVISFATAPASGVTYNVVVIG